MIKSLCKLVLFCLLLCSPTITYAGVWTQEKGAGYNQFSFTYISSSRLFLKDGSSLELRRNIQDITLQYYLEYGLTDKLTLVGTVPFKLLSSGEKILTTEPNRFQSENLMFFKDTLEAGHLNYWSNSTLGFKYLLHKGTYLYSFQLNGMSNSSKYIPNTGLRSGYDAWAIHPKLHFGRGWDKKYFTTEIGFRFRTNNYSDEFIANFEYGFKPSPKLWMIGVINVWESFFNGNFNDQFSLQTGTYVNNQESFSYGVKMIYQLNEQLGLNFNVFGAFQGNLVAHFPALTAAIDYRW